MAELLLEVNDDCMLAVGIGLAGDQVVTALDVLNGMFAGTISNLSYSLAPIDESNGIIISAKTTTTRIGDVLQGISVTFNTTDGAFSGGNLHDQTVALLHELGHVMTDLYGTGTSIVTPDGIKQVSKSENNSQKIDQHCFKNPQSISPILQGAGN